MEREPRAPKTNVIDATARIKEEKRKRLAKALRENLKRRKAAAQEQSIQPEA